MAKNTMKPKLTAIEGALSIYRKGDEVDFMIRAVDEGLRVRGTITETVVKDGKLLVWVSLSRTTLEMFPNRIDRIDRVKRTA